MTLLRVRIRSHLIMSGLVAVAVAVAGATLTNAAWVDNEYVYGGLGTDGKCEQDSGTRSTASARQLAGTMLGSDLDNLASIEGVQVINDGEGISTPSAGAIPIDDNTFMAPLDVDLLRAEVLQLFLPLNLPIGSANLYSQWSQTLNNGNTTAASGLITNSSGAIGLGQPQNPSDPPVMATLDLGTLAPAALAGMTLEIGAASSLAELTQCGDLGNGWLGPLEQPLLNRTYSVSSLDLAATLPAIATLTSATGQQLDGLQPGLNEALGDAELGMSEDLAITAAPLLGALTLGGIETQVTMAPADLTHVRALLTATMTDDTGLLTVNFGAGTVRIDLAKTAGGINGLNGMAPNTEVLLNQAMTDQLSAALTQVLDDWQENLTAALVAAIRATTVTVSTTVQVRSAGLPLAAIGLGLGPTTTGQLLDLYDQVPGTPTVPVTTSITMLGSNPFGLLTPTLNGLASGLASALPRITGEAFNNELLNGVAAGFASSVVALTGTVSPSLVAALDRLGSGLSIMVNVQPDQPGHPAPVSSSPFQVSALRLSFPALNVLDLSVASSSVGYGN